MDKILTSNSQDWHPADIKASLEKRGFSLRALAAMWGYTHIQKALREPWLAAEAVIAQAIGVPPETIWPSRYQQPRPRAKALTRKVKVSRSGRVRRVQEVRA